MKKLLALMLILAFCGIASATIDVYITDAEGHSEITLGVSDTIALYIWYTGDDISFFDTAVTCTGPGTISAVLGTYEDLGQQANPNITAANRNIQYDAVINLYDGEGEIIDNAYEMVGSSDGAALGKGMDPALAYVTFHCDGASPPDVVITLGDVYFMNLTWDQVFPTMHGMTIHQVPEPATIALLCLGGLLLRKK